MKASACKEADDAVVADVVGRAYQYEPGARHVEVRANLLRHADVALVQQFFHECGGFCGVAGLSIEGLSECGIVSAHPRDKHISGEVFELIHLGNYLFDKGDLHRQRLVQQQVELKLEALRKPKLPR